MVKMRLAKPTRHGDWKSPPNFESHPFKYAPGAKEPNTSPQRPTNQTNLQTNHTQRADSRQPLREYKTDHPPFWCRMFWGATTLGHCISSYRAGALNLIYLKLQSVILDFLVPEPKCPGALKSELWSSGASC